MNVIEGTNYITHLVEDMFEKAEVLFGKSSSTQIFQGVKIVDIGAPCLFNYVNKTVIHLNTNVISNNKFDIERLYFQLSHEVCHLLFADGMENTNVLEEGVTTYFSKYYSRLMNGCDTYADASLILAPNYRNAYLLIERLMGEDPKSIKKIREIAPSLKWISFDELKSFNFNLTDDEVNYLIGDFNNQ